MTRARAPRAVRLVMGGLLWASASCAATGIDPPLWVNNPPIEKDYLHGIGSYVGALHAEDNHGYAMDQARAMLSRSLQARVVNVTDMRDTETTTSSDTSYTSHTLVSTDHVLRNSELVATWVDYAGRTGRRGTVWVLMRIPREQSSR